MYILDTGFYVCPQKNQSDAVYDLNTSGSGSFIEAGWLCMYMISLLGISIEQQYRMWQAG